MLKVIIASSPGFNDYDKFCDVCRFMLQKHSEVEIVCSGMDPVRAMAQLDAERRGYEFKVFEPDIAKYKNMAQYMNNRFMIVYADVVIVFWNPEDRKEAYHLIRTAEGARMRVKVVEY